METRVQLKLLSADQVAAIREKCMNFLSIRGVKVNHPDGLKLLGKLGADVDIDNLMVRFPREIVETALKTVPRSFSVAGSDQSRQLELPCPNGTVYTRSSTGAVSYLEPGSNEYRDLLLGDVKEHARLMELLDGIHICGFPAPHDVPEATADIHVLRTLFENTSKHIIVQPYGGKSLEYLFEMMLVMAGNEENLRKNPPIHVICGSLPPLGFKAWNMEAIMLACRYGVPMAAGCLASSGGTAPVTTAGTVLLQGIVILAMTVMGQLIRPGLPTIGMPIRFTVDMSSGRPLQSTIDAILGTAAGTQFIKDAYGLPIHTYGYGTDSYIPDGQSMIEMTRMATLVSLAGGDILGGAGQVKVATAFSPIQLIIDNTLASSLARVNVGIQVDDETLAWEDILTVAPDGNFLESRHTVRHCREFLRQPLFALPPNKETWELEGSKDLYGRALDEYKTLKPRLQPRRLPPEVQKEMDLIVKRADEHLAK